jgi:hypothetical protein
LHSFDATDGADPWTGLVQATDGDFYGTTSSTVFKITPSGALTTLHNFDGTDGSDPFGKLIQATSGRFYGTTQGGGSGGNACGSGGCGTVFRLSEDLGTFVETQTTSGMVGAAIKILGTDLKGATSVTFNGTPATFTVVSKSHIKTTVPTGATTGFVQVATPGGTLTSNVVYTVEP